MSEPTEKQLIRERLYGRISPGIRLGTRAPDGRMMMFGQPTWPCFTCGSADVGMDIFDEETPNDRRSYCSDCLSAPSAYDLCPDHEQPFELSEREGRPGWFCPGCSRMPLSHRGMA